MLFLNYLHRLNGSHCMVSITCVCLFELDIYIYFFIFEIFIFHVSEILRATEISKDTLVTNVSKINRLQKLSDIMLCCG